LSGIYKNVNNINRTGVTRGIGADYNVAPNTVIRLSYDSYRVGGPQTSNVVGALDIGFVYRFRCAKPRRRTSKRRKRTLPSGNRNLVRRSQIRGANIRC